MIKKKRSISPEVQAKGAAALAEWRKAKAAAKARGPEAFAGWQEAEERKRALKTTSPIQAIKNFCNACVIVKADITNCTAKHCPIYIYRPYQDGEE